MGDCSGIRRDSGTMPTGTMPTGSTKPISGTMPTTLCQKVTAILVGLLLIHNMLVLSDVLCFWVLKKFLYVFSAAVVQ